MPVINVTLIAGYDEATRTRLCQRLTDAAMATIAAPADAVTVFVNEIAPAGYMRGRSTRTPGPAMTAPAELCLDFLAAQGARQILGCRALELVEQTLEQGAEENPAVEREVEGLPADGHERESRLGGRRARSRRHVGGTHGDGGGRLTLGVGASDDLEVVGGRVVPGKHLLKESL